MKNSYLLLLLAFLYSCSNSPQEQAILEHEQNFGGTKTDLSMKILSLKKVKDITAADSINILIKENFGDTATNETLRLYDTYINRKLSRSDSLANHYDAEYAAENQKDVMDKNFEVLRLLLNYRSDFHKESIKYSNMRKELDSITTRINHYGDKGNEVIASVWECTYSIKNPLLNNAKQELTKTYVFNNENKIVASGKN